MSDTERTNREFTEPIIPTNQFTNRTRTPPSRAAGWSYSKKARRGVGEGVERAACCPVFSMDKFQLARFSRFASQITRVFHITQCERFFASQITQHGEMSFPDDPTRRNVVSRLTRAAKFLFQITCFDISPPVTRCFQIVIVRGCAGLPGSHVLIKKRAARCARRLSLTHDSRATICATHATAGRRLRQRHLDLFHFLRTPTRTGSQEKHFSHKQINNAGPQLNRTAASGVAWSG